MAGSLAQFRQNGIRTPVFNSIRKEHLLESLTIGRIRNLLIQRLGNIQAHILKIVIILVHKIIHTGPVIGLQLAVGKLLIAQSGNHFTVFLFCNRILNGVIQAVVNVIFPPGIQVVEQGLKFISHLIGKAHRIQNRACENHGNRHNTHHGKNHFPDAGLLLFRGGFHYRFRRSFQHFFRYSFHDFFRLLFATDWTDGCCIFQLCRTEFTFHFQNPSFSQILG